MERWKDLNTNSGLILGLIQDGGFSRAWCYTVYLCKFAGGLLSIEFPHRPRFATVIKGGGSERRLTANISATPGIDAVEELMIEGSTRQESHHTWTHLEVALPFTQHSCGDILTRNSRIIIVTYSIVDLCRGRSGSYSQLPSHVSI